MRFSFLLAVLLAVLLALPAFAEAPLFTDVAPASGLGFTHWNGMTGELYFIEMTGQGGAFLDYDGDGDLDVYLVQGAKLPGEPLFPLPEPVPKDRLFRNDSGPGGTPRFVDVTESAGLAATGYGMGVAVGDVDNDGLPDLYVTNFGPNQLWRQRGDGTFEDASGAFGDHAEARWSTSAAFFDFDADGWLDLYVANYVDYRLEDDVQCFATSSRRDYCGPAAFPPTADRLWRNLGPDENGLPRFEDVTLERLRGYEPGPGLGVVSADLDGDGLVDLYVANDGEVNQLWLQRRGQGAGGKDTVIFRDEALFAGVAVNRAGRPEASMGLDAGDVDNDGDEDLILAHLMEESNTLYVNEGGGLFTDRSVESGLAAPSLAMTAFGAGFLDVDNDGFLDLLMVNGAVKIIEEQARAGDPFPLAQANQIFLNRGAGKLLFDDATARAGDAFAIPEVSRGAAFGDVDNDGDADILLTNNNGPARLLRNDAARAAWLGLSLRGPGGRPALGASATVRQGAARLERRARSDGSYCSAHDPRVIFGLGGAAAPGDVEIRWPAGGRTVVRGLPTNVWALLEASHVKRK